VYQTLITIVAAVCPAAAAAATTAAAARVKCSVVHKVFLLKL
jgi:hypothetical protein